MITKIRKSESHCYTALEECEILSHGDEAFIEEFRSFRAKVIDVMEDYGSCEIGGHEADFSFTPDDEDFDLSRVLSLVTSQGKKITKESIDRLSKLAVDHEPKYRIFIDGEICHGATFVIVIFPNKKIWGYEDEDVNLLTNLGFEN